MDFNFATLGVRLFFENFKTFMTYLILGVVLILSPCKKRLAGLNKVEDVVYMAVCLVKINASFKPDYLFKVKILFQNVFDFLFGKVWVSPLA